ncbi:MAG TPA: MFS transporter [Baekduia sp.]|uniref:MFS transporter n=1 Tax=Baekduia sp. TaxID=2600305 RepID=UPI002D0D34F0|nr:MFS transporter [Baekduia sp.]HMJ34223.1 MFS transporter [Baekduia sp.]
MRLLTLLRGPSDPEQRLMAIMTLVNMAGSGLYFAAGTLYLTRSAGMSPAEVGLGLTLGGLCGLVGGVVIGDQADRRGAREVVIVAMLVEAVAACALIAVHSVVALALVAGVAAIAGAGNGSGRGALIGLVAKEGEGAKLRSYLRAVTNVGLAIGSLGAALVLTLDTRGAYVGMLIADALSFVLAAAVVARLPRRPPTRTAAGDGEHDAQRWLALRDKPYLALTFSAAIASLQYEVPIVVLPLWVTLHTHAPRWSAAVLFLIAALLVAALQVPATRSIDGPRSAARMVLRSGPVFLAAWALIALSAGAGAGVALALLIAAIAIHSLAEVWQAGGMFELSFALARPEAQGQYQGVFGLSMGITEAVGPALLIGLCITWGQPGWLVLGAIVTLAGFACARIERWAAVRRVAPVPA